MTAAQDEHERSAFREICCTDCKIVLGRYSAKYFSDSDIAEIMHLHYSSHIKAGHGLSTRVVTLGS
jgi:hypothetical protein